MNIDVKQFCDENSKKFRDLFDLAKINYSYYIRTTDDKHKEMVHEYWNDLNLKNLIKSGNYEGYYSISDESFIPIKDLTQDPKTGEYKTNLNQPVEYITEISYLLNFKDYIDKFKSKLESKEIKYFPSSIINEVNELINSNMLELSISRPKNRVFWGITVPNSNNQVNLSLFYILRF